MDENINNCYLNLGLDNKATLEDVEKRYKELEEKNAREEIHPNTWITIHNAYGLLCEYLIKCNEEAEYKGPLWTMLRDIDIDEVSKNNGDIFAYIEENVLSVLPKQYKSTYKKFLRQFKKMWKSIYERICNFEYHLLVNGDLTSSAAFSVGKDELTIRRISEELGKYEDMFAYSKEISETIPGCEDDYLIQKHFELVGRFVGFDFEITTSGRWPIYTFLPNTRLKKFREEYLHKFDVERQRGERKSALVDEDDLLGYVTKSLKPFNKNIKKDSHNKKYA